MTDNDVIAQFQGLCKVLRWDWTRIPQSYYDTICRIFTYIPDDVAIKVFAYLQIEYRERTLPSKETFLKLIAHYRGEDNKPKKKRVVVEEKTSPEEWREIGGERRKILNKYWRG